MIALLLLGFACGMLGMILAIAWSAPLCFIAPGALFVFCGALLADRVFNR